MLTSNDGTDRHKASFVGDYFYKVVYLGTVLGSHVDSLVDPYCYY